MKIICKQVSAISFLIVNKSTPQKVITLKCYVVYDIAVARLEEQTRQVLQILKTNLVRASLRTSFSGAVGGGGGEEGRRASFQLHL